jgi:hypothetical protein
LRKKKSLIIIPKTGLKASQDRKNAKRRRRYLEIERV